MAKNTKSKHSKARQKAKDKADAVKTLEFFNNVPTPTAPGFLPGQHGQSAPCITANLSAEDRNMCETIFARTSANSSVNFNQQRLNMDALQNPLPNVDVNTLRRSKITAPLVPRKSLQQFWPKSNAETSEPENRKSAPPKPTFQNKVNESLFVSDDEDEDIKRFKASGFVDANKDRVIKGGRSIYTVEEDMEGLGYDDVSGERQHETLWKGDRLLAPAANDPRQELIIVPKNGSSELKRVIPLRHNKDLRTVTILVPDTHKAAPPKPIVEDKAQVEESLFVGDDEEQATEDFEAIYAAMKNDKTKNDANESEPQTSVPATENSKAAPRKLTALESLCLIGDDNLSKFERTGEYIAKTSEEVVVTIGPNRKLLQMNMQKGDRFVPTDPASAYVVVDSKGHIPLDASASSMANDNHETFNMAEAEKMQQLGPDAESSDGLLFTRRADGAMVGMGLFPGISRIILTPESAADAFVMRFPTMQSQSNSPTPITPNSPSSSTPEKTPEKDDASYKDPPESAQPKYPTFVQGPAPSNGVHQSYYATFGDANEDGTHGAPVWVSLPTMPAFSAATQPRQGHDKPFFGPILPPKQDARREVQKENLPHIPFSVWDALLTATSYPFAPAVALTREMLQSACAYAGALSSATHEETAAVSFAIYAAVTKDKMCTDMPGLRKVGKEEVRGALVKAKAHAEAHVDAHRHALPDAKGEVSGPIPGLSASAHTSNAHDTAALEDAVRVALERGMISGFPLDAQSQSYQANAPQLDQQVKKAMFAVNVPSQTTTVTTSSSQADSTTTSMTIKQLLDPKLASSPNVNVLNSAITQIQRKLAVLSTPREGYSLQAEEGRMAERLTKGFTKQLETLRIELEKQNIIDEMTEKVEKAEKENREREEELERKKKEEDEGKWMEKWYKWEVKNRDKWNRKRGCY